MSDERLRQLERDTAQGDPAAEVRLLNERIRTTGEHERILDEFIEHKGWTAAALLRTDSILADYLAQRPAKWLNHAEQLATEYHLPNHIVTYNIGSAHDAARNTPKAEYFVETYLSLAELAAERRDYSRIEHWADQVREPSWESLLRLPRAAARNGDVPETDALFSRTLSHAPAAELNRATFNASMRVAAHALEGRHFDLADRYFALAREVFEQDIAHFLNEDTNPHIPNDIDDLIDRVHENVATQVARTEGTEHALPIILRIHSNYDGGLPDMPPDTPSLNKLRTLVRTANIHAAEEYVERFNRLPVKTAAYAILSAEFCVNARSEK